MYVTLSGLQSYSHFGIKAEETKETVSRISIRTAHTGRALLSKWTNFYVAEINTTKPVIKYFTFLDSADKFLTKNSIS
jgi:hypothetical protein